jgi:adenine-specific DNA-methyltransferase
LLLPLQTILNNEIGLVQVGGRPTLTENAPMNGESLNVRAELLNALSRLAPSLVSEGRLNTSALNDLFGDVDAPESERYQISWRGKNDAYKVLQATSTSTLKPCVETSINWENSKNLFIEGENLEVLKLLQRTYFGKVRFIYIDPPYNTGSDSFIYPDKFSETKEEYLVRIGNKDDSGKLLKEGLFRPNTKENGQFHSNWLSMMLPRLFLARNLLSDDGVFVTSIDDNEAYSLKLVLDEVFGEENFAGDIIWNSTKSVTNTALLSVSHTHNLVYFKDVEYHKKNRYEFRLPDTPEGFSNPDNDTRGPWKADPFQVEGERPNQLYEIVNPKTGQKYVPNPGNSWKNDFEKFVELMSDNRIVFGTSGEAGPQRKRFWSEAQERGRVTKSLWTDVDTTANATAYLIQLMGKKVFTNPKPVDLIQRFIQLGTVGKNENNEIVMDFFGGSGTTAEAVMKQNKEDGGSRRFIFVTLPEPLDDKSQAGKEAKGLGHLTIADVAHSRISKAIEVLSGASSNQNDLFTSSDKTNVDLGFRHFKLTTSNIKNWRGDISTNIDELSIQLKLTETSENSDSSGLDIALEMVLKEGLDLSTPVVEAKFGHGVGHVIGKNEIVVIHGQMTKEDFANVIKLKPKSVICLDSIFNYKDSDKTNTQLQFEDAGIGFRTV